VHDSDVTIVSLKYRLAVLRYSLAVYPVLFLCGLFCGLGL